jgi:hypothetical protein
MVGCLGNPRAPGGAEGPRGLGGLEFLKNQASTFLNSIARGAFTARILIQKVGGQRKRGGYKMGQE